MISFKNFLKTKHNTITLDSDAVNDISSEESNFDEIDNDNSSSIVSFSQFQSNPQTYVTKTDNVVPATNIEYDPVESEETCTQSKESINQYKDENHIESKAIEEPLQDASIDIINLHKEENEIPESSNIRFEEISEDSYDGDYKEFFDKENEELDKILFSTENAYTDLKYTVESNYKQQDDDFLSLYKQENIITEKDGDDTDDDTDDTDDDTGDTETNPDDEINSIDQAYDTATDTGTDDTDTDTDDTTDDTADDTGTDDTADTTDDTNTDTTDDQPTGNPGDAVSTDDPAYKELEKEYADNMGYNTVGGDTTGDEEGKEDPNTDADTADVKIDNNPKDYGQRNKPVGKLTTIAKDLVTNLKSSNLFGPETEIGYISNEGNLVKRWNKDWGMDDTKVNMYIKNLGEWNKQNYDFQAKQLNTEYKDKVVKLINDFVGQYQQEFKIDCRIGKDKMFYIDIIRYN